MFRFMISIYKLILSLLLAFSLSISATGCGSNASSVSAKTNDGVGSDNPDEFTIRIGVNSLDNNFLLKILDNHTDFLKDKGITLETTEFSAGINTIDAITTDTVDITEAYPAIGYYGIEYSYEYLNKNGKYYNKFTNSQDRKFNCENNGTGCFRRTNGIKISDLNKRWGYDFKCYIYLRD